MPASSDLQAIFSKPSYQIAPEVLLLPTGPVKDHVLTVSDGKITKIDALSEGSEDIVRLPGKAIVPGFIDAHTHVGQIFGKALIGGEPAQIWRRIWHPMEIHMDTEASYASAKWAFLEAMRGGFTALVNYGLNDEVKNAGVHRAAAETGFRLVSACGLDEMAGASGTGVDNHEFSEISDRIDAHIEDCAGFDRVTPSVCCSSFYGNSHETLSALADYCRSKGVLLQIHSNEHFPEIHECVVRYGKRPIELLSDLDVLGPNVLLHHTTIIAENEIELLKETNTATSYNPLASIWKGNAVAPAIRFANRGVRFGIGSDTTSADAFKNLFAAEACQRVEHAMPVADFSCGAGWTWLDAASQGSASACGLSEETGRFEVGHKADFLVLDMDQPECLPSHDFEWEVVRYYNRDQVDALVIDGVLRMVEGRPVDWDMEAFKEETSELRKKISSTPGIVRRHGVSTSHRPS